MSGVALDQYIERATVDRIRRKWEAKGYQAIEESAPQPGQPDLLMRRGEDTIVFEVTTANRLRQRRRAIDLMAKQFANRPNTTFRLVVANPPQEKRIIDVEQIKVDTSSFYA